jgi:hypothetical protein
MPLDPASRRTTKLVNIGKPSGDLVRTGWSGTPCKNGSGRRHPFSRSRLPPRCSCGGISAEAPSDSLGPCLNLAAVVSRSPLWYRGHLGIAEASEGHRSATLIGGRVRRRQGIDPSESLPWRYPTGKMSKIIRKSRRVPSVRDRGVGGSNPLAPTNFLRKTSEIQSARPLGSRPCGGPCNP